jgi:hypothetical protein
MEEYPCLYERSGCNFKGTQEEINQHIPTCKIGMHAYIQEFLKKKGAQLPDNTPAHPQSKSGFEDKMLNTIERIAHVGGSYFQVIKKELMGIDEE